MKRNFVSNSQESTRMFKNGFLESLSKVHFTVPLFLYIPIIAYCYYRALTSPLPLYYILLEIVSGIFIWSFTEYFLHRFIFHYVPANKIGLRLHFIFHGVHHDYPSDKRRLVMPPSVSIPLSTGFYFLFKATVSPDFLWGFFASFLVGYLIYDIGHYAMHHFNFKSGLFKRLKQYHMLHHYQEPHKGYGVSSPFWDTIFNSTFLKKKTS
jgi:4-hydroxysphinganine ceramide fatty acyl 2-hydroxylase